MAVFEYLDCGARVIIAVHCSGRRYIYHSLVVCIRALDECTIRASSLFFKAVKTKALKWSGRREINRKGQQSNHLKRLLCRPAHKWSNVPLHSGIHCSKLLEWVYTERDNSQLLDVRNAFVWNVIMGCFVYRKCKKTKHSPLLNGRLTIFGYSTLRRVFLSVCLLKIEYHLCQICHWGHYHRSSTNWPLNMGNDVVWETKCKSRLHNSPTDLHCRVSMELLNFDGICSRNACKVQFLTITHNYSLEMKCVWLKVKTYCGRCSAFICFETTSAGRKLQQQRASTVITDMRALKTLT